MAICGLLNACISHDFPYVVSFCLIQDSTYVNLVIDLESIDICLLNINGKGVKTKHSKYQMKLNIKC